MAKPTATILITGDPAVLLSYAVQAVADGLTLTVPQEPVPNGNGAERATWVVESDEIEVGDRVRVTKPGYGCVTGEEGVVKFITRKTRGISVEVDWADGGGTSEIAGSYLQRVKKG
jgi:hypothetical protein